MTKALRTGPMAMVSDDTMSRSDPIRPKSRTTRNARIDLAKNKLAVKTCSGQNNIGPRPIRPKSRTTRNARIDLAVKGVRSDGGRPWWNPWWRCG